MSTGMVLKGCVWCDVLCVREGWLACLSTNFFFLAAFGYLQVIITAERREGRKPPGERTEKEAVSPCTLSSGMAGAQGLYH